MRTRTNVNYGYGLKKGVEILSNYYPAGNVNILYDERKEAEELCMELTAQGYKVDLKPYASPTFDSVGFVIGLGDEKVINKVKLTATKKFAFFPRAVCVDMLTPLCDKYAEFSYIDSAKINASNVQSVNEIHAALFLTITEAVAVCYKDAGSPFCDKALLGIVKRAKSILFGEIDIDDYVKEAIRAIENSIERLRLRGVENFLSARMANRLGGSLSDKIATAYFLNRLLILFTKWNFRDMLIPSEKQVIGIADDLTPTYGRDDLIITEAELTKITAKVKGQVEKPQLKRLVNALRTEIDGNNPLFAEIYNRGIPEGLVDYG